MSEKLMEFLEKQASRRGFFAQTAVACLTGVLAFLGLSKPARALRYVYCCCLCAGDCPNLHCNGYPSWTWCCCHYGKFVTCTECFNTGYTAGPWCTGVRCSLAFRDNIPCDPASMCTYDPC